MKRFVKIMSIAALFVCGMMMTGCAAANNIKEALSGPKDTWFSREITYKTGTGANEKSTNLVVFMCYSENGYTSTDMRTDVTINPGLTVVVIPSSEITSNEVVSGLITGKYLIKTFSNAVPTVVETGTDDSSSETTKLKMSSTKWDLIYNSVTNLERVNGVIQPLHKYNTAAWTELPKPSEFSWKKIMANYLLDRLLED